MKAINNIIIKLGRKNYSIDNSLKNKDLLAIVFSKCIDLVRGFYVKIKVKRSSGLVFVGKKSKIKHCSKISLGRTISIGDNVEINALSHSGIIIGNNFSILSGSTIECTGVLSNLGEGLVVGSNVGIAQNCFIQVRGSVYIGNNVIFGPGVSLFSENHEFSNPDIPVSKQGVTRKGVVIEDGVWVGAGAIILDGVTIGKNSVIAAGSVVNKSVPPLCVAGGVPAGILKKRN